MRISPVTTLFDDDVAADGYTSSAFSMSHLIGAMLTATITDASSLNATLVVQTADANKLNDTNQPPDDAVWVNVTSPTNTSTTVTADGSTKWNINNHNGKWLRVKFTGTAGTAHLKVTANGKGW